MLTKPSLFTEVLNEYGLIGEVYTAMSKPDLAEVVMTMLDIIKKIKLFPIYRSRQKSEDQSSIYRDAGNQAYGLKKFHDALVFYNKALLFAPKESRALKLAYSNRSALFHRVRAYSACLNDIRTCFALGCPLDIIEKLRIRKEDALNNAWVEKFERLGDLGGNTKFYDEFFRIDERRCHPEIPCAQNDVGVVIENNEPKVVATADIKVGTVIATETAFVSLHDDESPYFTCYYCHKTALNLRPCEGCCLALFCNEICQEKCMTEYHNIECQIMEAIDKFTIKDLCLGLAVKAVLKMKHLCKSWNDLIVASRNMGLSRIKSSSINEIYDSRQRFSLLSVKEERYFLHGKIYNASIPSACIVEYLGHISGFYPQSPRERDEAKRAVARLLMFLSLYAAPNLLNSPVYIKLQRKTEFHDFPNFGWFSFLGKLNNSCFANVLVVGLNNKIALVAQKPIKQGTELTIPHTGLFQDDPTPMHPRYMISVKGKLCNCNHCHNGVLIPKPSLSRLNDSQKRTFHKLDIYELHDRLNGQNLPEIYTKVCKALASLCDVPLSTEYDLVSKMFGKCILFLQDYQTENIRLDYE